MDFGGFKIAKYILRRLIYSVPTIISITVIIFIVMRVVPGDVLSAFYGTDEVSTLTPEQRQNIMEQLGLADPLYIQYGNWIWGLLHGDLGNSFFRSMSVSEYLAHRAPISIEIALFATILSWIIAIPVGLISALRRNSKLDYISRTLTIFFLAVPSFWLALLSLSFFVLVFNWHSSSVVIQIWDNPSGNFGIIWRPAVILALSASAPLARMMRATILEVMSEDYIRTARAKGLANTTVVSRHAIRNAILPTVTYSGIIFGFLLGGSVAVESALGARGLGEVLVRAIQERDVMMVQNLVLIYGLIWTAINIIVDLTYAWLDPRIRYE
jgi:peptide/nickel transport system permease protein